MRLILEELEARVVLSADASVLGLPNGIIADPPILLNQEHEPNDTLAQANPLQWDRFYYPLGDGPVAGADANAIWWPGPWRDYQSAYVHGDLDHDPSGGDLDYFTFTTEANRVITLSVYGAAVRQGAAPVLLDASGEVLAEASTVDWDNDGSPDAATIEYTSADGGQFFVKVGPATSPSVSDSSEYSLTVSTVRAPAREQEPNDTQDQANPITLEPDGWWGPWVLTPAGSVDNMPIRIGWGLHGLITGNQEGTDTDWFSFSSAAERSITLTLDGGAVHNGAVPELVDAQGRVVASAETFDWDDDGHAEYATLSYYTRAGGDFFVHLRSEGTPTDGADTGTGYTLTINVQPDPYNEHEPNDTLENANPIEFGFPYRIAWPLPVELSNSSIIWPEPGGEAQHGWISAQVNGDDPAVADLDHFSLDIPAERHVRIDVHSYQSAAVDRIALLDANGVEIAADADGSDGFHLEFTTEAAGRYYVQVHGFRVEPDGTDPDPVNGIVRSTSSFYQVSVTVTPPAPPEQGADEHEPNNTFDTANWLNLDYLPTFAPGIELRGGDVRGIAGGPNRDQDVFQFDAYAGETVHVGINDANVANGALVQVVVFDSEGQQVGQAKGSGIVFEPLEDDCYYAVVTVKNAGGQVVNYRLGVLAQEYSDPDDDDDGIDESGAPPLQVTLNAGGTYTYTDADGDAVTVTFKGKAGQAVITFTGSAADGSDIASIVIQGTRSGGTLSVQTEGAADVGAVDIQAPVRRGRTSGKFGTVDIDGDLGVLRSNLDLQKVLIDGVLGEVHAHGRTVGKLQASVFNLAMADAILRSHRIQQDDLLAALLFADG